ncbi:MAG: hypothetical protein V1874_10045 [Spirochaetota bacterium]
MLIKKTKISLLVIVACVFLFVSNNIYSAGQADNKLSSYIPYKPIEISALSRYFEDRIVFQHIQLPGFSLNADNSIASLLVIKNDEIYLFHDGFDDVKKISFQNYLRVINNDEPVDLWVNKINSRPDYLRIANRKVEKLLNSNENYAEKNSGDIYRSIRNSFLHNHVKIFKGLMMNRVESDFKLDRKPIFPPAFKEMNAPIKFSSVIKAKAHNDYRYYAEDKDGDEITETFYVTMNDSFNWGFKSGPNVIFIYNNKEDDIKQFIGKLCYEAYFGTSAEETELSKLLPKDTDILKTFNLEKLTLQTPPPEKQAEPKK